MLQPVPLNISLRLLAYTVVLVWLALDLLVLHGPLYRRLQGVGGDVTGVELTGDLVPAAVVYGRVITLRELDQRLKTDRLRAGQAADLGKMHVTELREARETALEHLILERLIDVKTDAREEKPAAPEIEAAIEAATAALGGGSGVERLLKTAGLTIEAWHGQIAADLARERYLERVAGQAFPENELDEAAMVWYGENRGFLLRPSRARLRHWFRASLHQDPDELEAAVRAMHRAIEAGETGFAEACIESSDDLATRESGGSLGWVARDEERLPGGLDLDRIFGATETGLLHPMKSELGWHIFYVEEVEGPREATFEEMREDIRAHLRSQARGEILRQIQDGLRADGIVTRYPSTLDLPPTS